MRRAELGWRTGGCWALVPSRSLGAVSRLRVDRRLARRPDRQERRRRRTCSTSAGSTFDPGEIRIRVTNPQPDDLTIGSVTVDDAIVPFELDGPRTLKRLRSSTIDVHYDWVEDEPISVGVTSSTGIETREDDRRRGRDAGGLAARLPRLRADRPARRGSSRSRSGWLAAVAARARTRAGSPASWRSPGACSRSSASRRSRRRWTCRRRCPGALGGAGPRAARRRAQLPDDDLRLASHVAGSGGAVGGVALATLVALGIGLHNLGEGLAIGSSFALGELTLGTFLIVGFMIHNITEGLGIAAPIAERRPGVGGAARRRLRWSPARRRFSAPGSAAS